MKGSDECLKETFGVTNRQRHLEIHSKSIGELALNSAETRCLTQWAVHVYPMRMHLTRLKQGVQDVTNEQTHYEFTL